MKWRMVEWREGIEFCEAVEMIGEVGETHRLDSEDLGCSPKTRGRSAQSTDTIKFAEMLVWL